MDEENMYAAAGIRVLLVFPIFVLGKAVMQWPFVEPGNGRSYAVVAVPRSWW
jgi:hypothetical protein